MDVIVRDTERDNYMTAEQAKEYGLIDLCHYQPLIRFLDGIIERNKVEVCQAEQTTKYAAHSAARHRIRLEN